MKGKVIRIDDNSYLLFSLNHLRGIINGIIDNNVCSAIVSVNELNENILYDIINIKKA